MGVEDVIKGNARRQGMLRRGCWTRGHTIDPKATVTVTSLL
jgi:hypothetical protein